MHTHALRAAILCFILAFGAAAFAADSSDAAVRKNPVVDVSALVDAGLWRSTTVRTVDGKPRKSTSTTCTTSQELRDFLNRKNAPLISSYRLDGTHLHYEAVLRLGGESISHLTTDIVFDDPDHAHGTVTAASNLGGVARKTVVQYETHRIGPCKGNAGGAD
ncbi:MAG: hypothetical protein L0I62_08270 [Gammaproteobacteria bacterium]|nr:hypothetical protein [Gammaproteobacteria bacterium]